MQTITSIGYGNILPYTPAEWWVAALLQLSAGLTWAYVIGGLVGVVTAMEVKNEIFRGRLEQANHLISVFLPPESESRDEDQADKENDKALLKKKKKKLSRSIRRYIYTQANRPWSTYRSISNLDQAFPVLESLSPEQRRSSSLLLLQKYLNKVRYLSSRFLSCEDQARVAEQCMIMEFPCGEVIRLDEGVSDLGRGILSLVKGLAWRSRRLQGIMPILHNGAFGAGDVLSEDGHPGPMSKVHFLSYSMVIFIPREAVLSALARNPSAWKCARWAYAGSCIIERAKTTLQIEKETSNEEVLMNNDKK